MVGLLLDEAQTALEAAGISASVVEVPEAGGYESHGRWRVIRARTRGQELELTVARQRELADAVEPGV